LPKDLLDELVPTKTSHTGRTEAICASRSKIRGVLNLMKRAHGVESIYHDATSNDKENDDKENTSKENTDDQEMAEDNSQYETVMVAVCMIGVVVQSWILYIASARERSD
jgi:hypothetical protein